MNKVSDKDGNHEELKSAVSNELKSLEDKVSELKSKAIGLSASQYDKAVGYVKAKPLLAVGIAAGIGAVLGLCLKRK